MKLAHALTLLFLLTAAWLLWSGHYTFEHGLLAVFAVGSIVFTLWLTLRLERVSGTQSSWPRVLGLARYLPWLTLEIVKSSLTVARLILHPKMPISPGLVRVRATQKTDLGRSIFANSITLTPGTITLDIRGEHVLVHALTELGAEDLEGGEMDARCTRMEGAS